MKINMKYKTSPTALSLVLLTSLLPFGAWAQEPAAAEETQELGARTRALVDLQVSNNAAMGAARPMPGEIADQVFTRYAKSFTHPIPEHFERDKFSEGSGGSQ